MNRFPDTFQTVIDRSLFGPNFPHGKNTLTKWLTISGCVAQALTSSTHSSTVRQTIMSAMSQHLQSDFCAAGATDPTQHRLLLPKLDILAVDADEAPPEEWEAEDDDHWTHVRSKLLVKRKHSIVGHGGIRVFHRNRIKGTGRNPVDLKWIDTNKGSAEAPRYRPRMVCTAVRHKVVEPIFSATPPLVTLRILLCVACQEDIFRVQDPFLISVTDVSRAHFYADAVRDVYVRLPDEDPKAKQPSECGKLQKTMYGPLDAAQWSREQNAQVLETGGFSRGVASPCHFSTKTWRRFGALR